MTTRHSYRVQALEVRRLLAFEFFGTSGDDTILVQYNASQEEYRFTLNGAPAGATQDADIIIFAAQGNDSLTFPYVADETDITVRGGSGDDRVTVGNGNLSTALNGRLFIEEQGGSGLADELIADDSLDNLVPDHPVTFRPSNVIFFTHALYSDNIVGGGGGSVHFDQNLDIVGLLSSSSADTVQVDLAPRGMSLSLGGGNDTVIYGERNTRVLQDVMPMGSVDGGDGADNVIFMDDGGPALGRAYEFSSSQFGTGLAMNQQLNSIQALELRTRNTGGVGGNTPNSVLFEGGFPVTDDVLINGGGLGDRTFIGTPTAPIDLDNTRVNVTTTNPGHKEIYDQDFGSHQATFVLLTGQSPLRQIVATDVFRAEFVPVSFDVNRNIDIHGGSTNDVFQINSTLAGRDIGIFGGGGNDQVLNFGSDLDAVIGSPVFVAGGEGDDSLILDDSQDQTNDDDNEYRLLPSLTTGWIFDKAGTAGQTGPVIHYSDSVENVTLTADAGNSTIRLQGLPTQHLSVDGGGGNDFITNARFGQNGSLVLDHPGSAVIVGGAGSDSISINDQANGLVSEYELTPSQFLFRSGLNPPRTLAYDGSTESFFLDQSNAATTPRLIGKPTATRLNVSAFGGDDTVVVGGGDIDASGISSATTTLLGGAGEDRIVFDDRLDDHGPLDNDEFTFLPQQINKDGTTIVYSAFESQKLITSGVNSSGVAAPNKVRVNAVNMPTEIEGSAGARDNTVDVNAGFNINLIAAPITLLFDNAPVVVSFNDQAALAARQFQFSKSQMSLPVVINYAGVEDLFVYAGSGGDTLTVTGTPAGMNVFFNGGSGDEMMSLGSAGGALTDLAGRVFAVGGDGVDRLLVTNGAAGGFTDGVLLSGGFRANGGPTHLFQTLEVVSVTVNAAGSSINVNSLSFSTGINGGSGDDLVTIGAGDLDANILSSIFVHGAGGFDRLVIDDRNGTNQPGTPPEYRLDVFMGTAGPVDRLLPNPVASAAFFIACLEVEHRQFDASSDANLINVIDSVHDVRINGHGGTDVVNVTDATGLVTLDTGAGSDSVTVNADSGTPGDAPLTVLFDRSDDLHYLDLRAGGTLRVAPDAVLLKTTGTGAGLALGGTLDLAGGSMLLRAAANVPSQATLRAKLVAGRNGGAWNGTSPAGAVNSSLAAGSPIGDGVGYGLGSQIAPTTIGPFGIGPNDTLVRYALDGDANLDGLVNLADFNRLASNFGLSGRAWVDGDSNYDDVVNLADFNRLASNFGGAAAMAGQQTRSRAALRDLLDELR